MKVLLIFIGCIFLRASSFAAEPSSTLGASGSPAGTRSSAEGANPYRFALGLNYLGGQIRYDLDSRWSGELRYLTGSEDAATGKITSQIFGLRGYRFFRADSRYRFFLGTEAALVNSDQKNTSYTVSGPAIGGFGGVEYRFGKRFSLGLDIGPYLLSLKEEKTDVSETSLEFIANTFLILYLF
ncbi:MAG: outer membrane beta-barrel protein [Elusimicrobia bacterium]|nr:outer membrane beta-barrel protein [Elusimicrobiota bacterium]